MLVSVGTRQPGSWFNNYRCVGSTGRSTLPSADSLLPMGVFCQIVAIPATDWVYLVAGEMIAAGEKMKGFNEVMICTLPHDRRRKELRK